MFALNSVDAVKYMSIAHSVSGFLGFCNYMVHASRKKEIIDYRKLLILAYTGFLLFHIVSFPFPFNTGKLKTFSQKCKYFWFWLNIVLLIGRAPQNFIQLATFKIHCLDYDEHNLTNPVGCPTDKFSWCYKTGEINFWVFIIGIVFFLGICWPNVNVSLSTLLSKILGPRRQANQQSIYQMSASAARLVGPIVIR